MFKELIPLRAGPDSWSQWVLHGSWQAALVAVAALLVVRLGRNWSSPLRYAILVVALLKFAAPPFLAITPGAFSLFRISSAPQAMPVSDTINEQGSPVTASDAAVEVARIDAGLATAESGPSFPQYPPLQSTNAAQGVGEEALLETSDSSRGHSDASTHQESTFATAAPKSWLPNRRLIIGLMSLHLLGIVVCLTLTARALRQLRRATRAARAGLPQWLEDEFESLLGQLHVFRRPRLLVSDAITVPISFGVMSPVVMIPTRLLAMTETERRAALAHEIAHHTRFDPWVNWLQNVLFMVWWLHPMIYFLNRAIRSVREQCCDDLLIARGIVTSDEYGQSLLSIARASHFADPHFAAALGMSSGHPIGQRIRRLMNPAIQPRARLTLAGGALAILAAMIALSGLQTAADGDATAAQLEASGLAADQSSGTAEGDGQVDSPNAEAAKEVTLSGRAVDQNDKGVAGATVTFQAEVYENESRRGTVVKAMARAMTEEDGSFSLKLPVKRILSDQFYSGYVLIEHVSGLGWHRTDNLSSARRAGGLDSLSAEDLNLTVQVNPTRALTVRVVSTAGEPLPSATLRTISLFKQDFNEYRRLSQRNFYIRGIRIAENLQQEVRGNALGEYVLPRIPLSGSLRVEVSGLVSGGRLILGLPCDEPATVRLDPIGTIEGKIACADPSFDPTQVSLEIRLTDPKVTGPDSGAYPLNFVARDLPVLDGGFKLSGLMAGTYAVTASLRDAYHFYAQQTPQQTLSSERASSQLRIEFTKSSRMRGRVLNKGNGEGVSDATVHLSWSDPDTRAWQSFGQLETDDNGYFEGYARPGSMSAYLAPLTDNLRPVSGGRQSTNVADSNAVTTMPDIEVTPGAALSGVVVNQAGEPQPHAEIRVLAGDHFGGGPPEYLKANAQGRFEIGKLDPDDTIALRAQTDNAVTDGAVVVDPAEGTESVRLVVSPAHSFYVAGQVVRSDGNPVADAEVKLQWNRNYVSRKSPGTGIGSTYQTLKSGADGRFRTKTLWPGDRYRIRVSADGYRAFESHEVTGTAGETHDFGALGLIGTASAVSGRVVDTGGRPIPNVTVFNRGDGPTDTSTTTGTDGRFQLDELAEGTVFVFARKEDMWFSGKAVEAPSTNVELTLHEHESAHAMGTLRRFSYAERKALAEEFLRQLYALPLEQRRKINFLILRHMARANPAVAMEWLDDPENESRRNDVLMTIADSIIDDKPDEALSIVRQVQGRSHFYRVLGLANRIRSESPELARRLAEDLVIRVRKTNPPNRIYQIAQTGRLLLDLGERQAGEALLEEAFEAATQLGGDAREGFVRGFAAEQLAPYNVGKALQLVEGISETDSTSKERHLGNIAVALAPHHPDRAAQMVMDMEARFAVRVAHHIADNDVDRALSLVTDLKGRGAQRYRAEALAWIAMARHHSNPQQAYDLIDQSFDILLSSSEDFDSWTNFGYEAVPAANVAALAAEMQHPNLASAVMRAVAARRNADSGSEIDILQAQAKMAKFIALADRNTAKQLLWQLDNRSELLGGGGYQSIDWDDWLTAWCLSDKDQARKVFQEALNWELARSKGALEQRIAIRVIGRLVLPDKQLHAELSRNEALWYPGNE